MKTLPMIILLLVPLLLTAQDISNVIINGDFEEDIENWSVSGNVYLSRYLSSSGENSIGFSTNICNHGFLYQSLPDSFFDFDARFWVFPQSDTFHNIFELVHNWDRTTADLVSRIVMKNNSIQFVALYSDTTIQFAMELNRWYHFSIKSDSNGTLKKYYIDGILICSLRSTESLPIETLIFGDLSNYGQFGALHYDDIGVFPKVDSDTTAVYQRHFLKSKVELKPNYPNPFNPITKIEYYLEEPQKIRLDIYNIRGKRVKNLIDGLQDSGEHSVEWNGTDNWGTKVGSGLYYYQIRTKNGILTQKMVFIK